MKVLIATDCYIFNLGGVTTSVLALCKGLRSYGHEVKILSLSNKNESFRNGEDFFIRSFRAFYYTELRMSFAKKDPLLQELEEWCPDIIHVQTEGAVRRFSNAIMKHCNSTMIMTCHTDYSYYLFGKGKDLSLIKGVMSLSGRFLYRKAAKITVPSSKAARFPFLSKVRNRITIVPNGMELEKYQKRFEKGDRHKFRMALGIEDHTGVLVSVSRLSKEKNIQELISYLPGLKKKWQDVKLLIVGDGPYRQYLEKLTDDLDLRDSVIFAGRVTSEDVWRYYAAADIFVSGSTFEVHSMSYLEALAGRLPLLCREDESLNGVLDQNENGFIYHSREDFVDFAYILLSNDHLLKEMGDRSYRKAEDFSSKVFASSMINIYNEAISKRVSDKLERKDGK